MCIYIYIHINIYIYIYEYIDISSPPPRRFPEAAACRGPRRRRKAFRECVTIVEYSPV